MGSREVTDIFQPYVAVRHNLGVWHFSDIGPKPTYRQLQGPRTLCGARIDGLAAWNRITSYIGGASVCERCIYAWIARVA